MTVKMPAASMRGRSNTATSRAAAQRGDKFPFSIVSLDGRTWSFEAKAEKDRTEWSVRLLCDVFCVLCCVVLCCVLCCVLFCVVCCVLFRVLCCVLGLHAWLLCCCAAPAHSACPATLLACGRMQAIEKEIHACLNRNASRGAKNNVSIEAAAFRMLTQDDISAIKVCGHRHCACVCVCLCV